MRIDMTHEGLFIDGNKVTDEEFRRMCDEYGFKVIDELPSRCVHCNGPGDSHLRSCPMSETQTHGIAARPQEVLAGLERQAEHNYQMLLKENERLSKELEQAKLLFNDLARENEALREAGQMTPDVLKKYCDNARAYGWEAGRLFGAADSVMNLPTLQPIYNSHPSNPFVNPDWDKDLKLPQGFMVTAKENPL